MELTVEKLETKQTKAGKSYKLVNGKWYIWDGKIVLEKGKKYEVETQDGDYPRITKATPIATDNPKTNLSNVNGNREDMMILSYAKDIALKCFEKTEYSNPFMQTVDVCIAIRIANNLLQSRNLKGDDFMKLANKVREVVKNFGVESIDEQDPEDPDIPAPKEDAEND